MARMGGAEMVSSGVHQQSLSHGQFLSCAHHNLQR
jgi:hypothetical protein